MRTPSCRLLLVAAGLSVAGCSNSRPGLNIGDITTLNAPLPRDFTGRLFYPDSASARSKLGEVVGQVLTIHQDNTVDPLDIERYVLGGAMGKVTALDKGQGSSYHSKLSQEYKASVKGTYLASISTELVGGQLMEVAISDVVYSSLKLAQLDKAKLRKLAQGDMPLGVKRRCVIVAAWVASVDYRVFSKLSSMSSIAHGDLFQAGGELYVTESTLSHDSAVSLDCRDFGRTAGAAKGIESPSELDELLMKSLADERSRVTDQEGPISASSPR